ncbi:hypothetical protein AB0O69_05365 [Streptomyces xiamenensis]|jgi:hypothetical protein|uniref:effector-associated constant component EACC1 n=1 Tax=Streptomyces TaxID=1883 RepID=UPI001903F066|nr:hypothetical protein [Streptomyces sp. XC 2026]QQN79490.1 hypothetical protein IPZ77_20230 [Streptomyces sp. XC 2026]
MAGETVRLTVSVPADADGGENLAALYAWLAESPRVTATAELIPEHQRVPGAMGERLERVNVVAGLSLAAIGLVLSAVTVWQDSQPDPVPVRVEIGTVIVEVDRAGPAQIQRLAEQLLEGAVNH